MFKLKGNNVKLIELISLKVLIVACFFIVALFAFGFIAREVIYKDEKTFDTTVFNFFASFTNPGLITVMKILTFFGTIQFLAPVYAILVAYFIIKKRFRRAIDISIVALSSSVFMFGLKDFFQRERPELPIIRSFTYSFPSGHALCSFIFCSVLIYLIDVSDMRYLWKWILSILLLLFSFAIGISRIILKMHYATDVIAGFCLGVVWVILSFWILRRVNYRNIFGRKKKPQGIDKYV
jgi:undecaprenyl-diphosphatase